MMPFPCPQEPLRAGHRLGGFPRKGPTILAFGGSFLALPEGAGGARRGSALAPENP
jgi:hypothetical protein